MRRRLFNVAAALSLVLCVATVALWVRSYRVCDLWVRLAPPTYSNLYSVRGEIRLSHIPTLDGWDGPRYFWTWRGFRVTRESVPLFRAVHTPSGLELLRYSGPAPDGYTIGAPHWFIALMSIILPARWLWPRIRTRYRREGFCETCGYDLRATPDRCPECGAEAKPQPAEGAAA